MRIRQIRNANDKITAAILRRSSVVPAGPIVEKSVFAIDAPMEIETMAITTAASGAKRPEENKVERRPNMMNPA
ncbi:MAG: hypothetical protein RBR34_13035, partial [Rhodospirillaceae bacterium]|nr:hypothetical protein [Rhodospirillaceae bacterium]